MSRRPSVSSGEPEPSAPVLPAAHSLASPSQSGTLLEAPDGERSNGAPLALLGDNICSSSPANGNPKVEHPETEAANYLVSSPPDPSPEFIAEARGRARVYCNSVKLESPPSSKSTPVTHPASLVSETEDSLAQLENNKPADKNNNNQSSVVHHHLDQNNEAPIIELTLDLVLGLIHIVDITIRTVVSLITIPFSIAKQTAKQTAACESGRHSKDPVHRRPYLGSTTSTMEPKVNDRPPRRRGSRWSLFRSVKDERSSSAVKVDASDTAQPLLHDTQSVRTKASLVMSETDTNVGCTTSISSLTDRAKQQNNENEPPAGIEEERTTPASTNQAISRSRTFNVFSSLTHTFSRTSLLSHSTASSQDLQNPSATATAKTSRTSLSSRFGKKVMAHDINTSTEVTESVPASEEASSVPPIHPRFVSTAQTLVYWSGRFSTTHDKLLDELLEPRNLKVIIDAQTIQSEISNDTDDSTSATSVPPASAFNNPSTSVYASTRIVPTRNYNIDTPPKRLPDHEQLGLKTTENRHTPFYMRGVRKIPHSATSDAVMQTPRKSSTYVSERNPAVYKTVHHDELSYQKGPSPSMIPRRVIPRSESSTVLPRRPLPRIPHIDSEGVIHIYAPDSDDSYPSESFRMKNTDRPRWLKSESQIQAEKEREAMLRRVTVADAAALTDDNDRCRRVFLQLEECCTTDEARNSLYVFQQTYARKHNREDLLPKGGTMHDPRTLRYGVFSKGLFGSRRSMGSLPPRYGGDVSTAGLNVDLGQYQSEVRSWKAERSLLQVPRRVFSHNRSVSMKFDGLEPSSSVHRLERYGTVRGVPGNNGPREGQYQHRTGFM